MLGSPKYMGHAEVRCGKQQESNLGEWRTFLDMERTCIPKDPKHSQSHGESVWGYECLDTSSSSFQVLAFPARRLGPPAPALLLMSPKSKYQRATGLGWWVGFRGLFVSERS